MYSPISFQFKKNIEIVWSNSGSFRQISGILDMIQIMLANRWFNVIWNFLSFFIETFSKMFDFDKIKLELNHILMR